MSKNKWKMKQTILSNTVPGFGFKMRSKSLTWVLLLLWWTSVATACGVCCILGGALFLRQFSVSEIASVCLLGGCCSSLADLKHGNRTANSLRNFSWKSVEMRFKVYVNIILNLCVTYSTYQYFSLSLTKVRIRYSISYK